jgi:multiple sugar transport system permease protein
VSSARTPGRRTDGRGARRPQGGGRGGRGGRGGIRGHEAAAGWLFTAPAVLMIVLFLVVPIVMAGWVSLSDWSGIGNPFGGGAHYVGAQNYSSLLTQPGLPREQFVQSLTNNAYYVLLVVPLQTILALFLAVAVNRRRLAGRGFFRTAYYFPTVTSTVAISILFLFLFNGSGVINTLLNDVGANGPTWFADPNGLIHLLLGAFGVHNPPGALANHGLLGQSWWDWLSGPSIAMTVLIILSVWTTSGTFMLIFLAALQNIPAEVEEAAIMDGTNGWQRLRRVTLPMLRPTLFLVLTLGLIACWQVFDQVYIMSQGNPAGTTLTPAYLSYQTSFGNQQWGQGAAISFLLFAIIVVLTLVQRFVLRERDGGTK